MRTEDNKYSKGEGVAEDELAYSGEDHGRSAEHVKVSAKGSEGGGGGALELEEGKYGAAERNEEAEEPNKSGVS